MTNANRIKKRVLLVENIASTARQYRQAMEGAGYIVIIETTVEQALKNDAFTSVDLIVVDIGAPGLAALSVLRASHEIRPDIPLIVISDHGSVNTAVEVMRKGATDFLVRPVPLEKLLHAMDGALSAQNMRPAQKRHNATLVEFPQSRQGGNQERRIMDRFSHRDFGGFIGTSQTMLDIYNTIEHAARSNATVFITGESGTGKEVCAEAIHKHSARANRPFIAINCAAIPRDLLESELFGHVKGAFTGATSEREGAASLANTGTLFLDEIAEMDPNMQTNLLRFLQNLNFQKVGGSRVERSDVRIICATSRDPLEEVRTGRLREDLYYRLHVIPINMPPLRARGDDIIDIAYTMLRHYADEENKRFEGFSPDAELCLETYQWPGNIRELQNVIRHIVVLRDGPLVTAAMLPEALRQRAVQDNLSTSFSVTHIAGYIPPEEKTPLRDSTLSHIAPLWQVEREAIERAIKACDGNIPRAAALLEISPSTIYRKKIAWEDAERTPEDRQIHI